jgi:hypothetical protein
MVIPVGQHRARIDDDVLLFEMVGELSLDEINRYIGLAEEIKSKFGYFFIIDDLSRFTSATAAVRKRVAGWLGQSGCRACALYGASLTARTLAFMVIGAMKLLGAQNFPISFCKTEQEARNFVATQRRIHVA